MWASRAAAAASKTAPPPAVVRGGPVPTASPSKRAAVPAGQSTPTRKPRVEAKLIPVSQFPDAQISQAAPEIVWTPELSLDDAAALAHAATALHSTVHGLLEEDRDTKWATAKLSARLELTKSATTAGKWKMVMSVDPVMWLNQILPQVVPEAAQREALAQAYVAANPDPAKAEPAAADAAAASAAALAAANAKVPLTCWYCTIPNCDGACESKQSAERGSLPIVHPDYLCLGPVCSSNKDETCCAWYSKKELIILDSWCKGSDATKAYIVEARRELIREIMMFPRPMPVDFAENGNHKNSCQLMCDVNTWKAAAALAQRVPCELMAINLGRWESFMHKNKNAWECHGQMHFYVEKAFVDALGDDAEADLVNLKGHNGDPTDYNVHNIRALAKYLHHTTNGGAASGAKSPEKEPREPKEKVKPISAPDADGWQEVVVGRGKGAKAGGRGERDSKTPTKTGK